MKVTSTYHILLLGITNIAGYHNDYASAWQRWKFCVAIASKNKLYNSEHKFAKCSKLVQSASASKKNMLPNLMKWDDYIANRVTVIQAMETNRASIVCYTSISPVHILCCHLVLFRRCRNKRRAICVPNVQWSALHRCWYAILWITFMQHH